MRTKRNLKMWLVMAVLLAGMAPAIAAGGTIHVDADASPGGDGSSWATAYKYLQDALYKPPTSGDQIWVAEGTYYPDEDEGANVDPNDRTETFQLINGVAIYGGYAGVGAGDPNERDVELYETILSGDLNGDDVGFTNNGENSYHVVTGSGTDATASLDGFIITAGNANGSVWPDHHGGGMFNLTGSPTVTNCTFSENSASLGGGMYNYGNGSPTVTNCTFSGNSTNQGGGMMNHWFSSPTLTNCTFSGNSAYRGGGMGNADSSPTLTNCTFSGNSAVGGDSARGGGINNEGSSGGSSPTVTNCILWGDSPDEIYVYTGAPVVTYSDVQGGYGGTGNINADPCFVDADGDDNIVGTEDDNLRLSAGSPCIDAGDNTAVPGGVTTDLDGNLRILYGIVDMGAYEYQPPPPPSSIIYVDADATGGANNGTIWADAFTELRDALSVAATYPDVNEIRVAEGIYKPDEGSAQTPGDRTATFELINGVALYGGYAGVNEPDPNERDWRTNETILSGDLDGNDVQDLDPCDLLDEPTRGENSYQVVTGSGTNGTAILDGFTITAGNADGSEPENCGGGMYNYLGGPTVTNCTFSGNSAHAGGGMYNDGNSPTVTNCTFIGNSASADGGGMNNENSSPVVSNCAFIGNLTEDGGGMCNYSSSPTVTNCTFTGNSAISPDVYVLGGGAMCNVEYSSPTVTNCILWGNSSPEPNGPQIALKDNSTVSISYCDLQGGQAAIYSVGTNSIIWGTGNIDEDPLFIGPNGLDRIPGTADDEEDNVHLRGYSPCINASDPGNYSGQVDIDRQPRVAYGRVDMGADEVFPIAGDFEPDGDVDFGDFAIFAGNWLLGH